jgi:hypothetical protein
LWNVKEKGEIVQELVWRREVKGSMGRHRRRFEDENKVELQEIVWVYLDWIYLTRGADTRRALLYVVISFTFQKHSGIILTTGETINF